MKRLDRRHFIKHSGLTLAIAGFPSLDPLTGDVPHGCTWDAAMARDWQRPARLEAFIGVHPRLFLTEKRLGDLRLRIKKTHREIWDVISEKADAYVKQEPPLDYTQQQPMRLLGRGIPWQALAYTLTGERKYLDGAKKWILGACELPRWQQNHSLAGGECLFGVGIGYDWLHHCLSVAERNLVKEKLILQARAMKDGPPQHNDRWLTNHSYIEHLGMAAAAFAIFGEAPEAVTWVRQSDLFFRAVLEFVGDDGSSHEGHQYWGYAVESLLRYLELARELMGRDYYRNSWLRAASSFVIQSTIPDFSAGNCVMSFGDSHRNYASHGPTHILYRLAAEYRDGHAQWLAREMDRREVGRGDFCTWTSLFWYDDTLTPVNVKERPTFWNCDDVGWITMRSGWEDDAVLVGFKCGPMHGHRAQRYYTRQFQERWSKYHNVGAGHGHPDANSFQVYAHGKWLAIDPLYERPKLTKTHATILVDGQGQVGEGKTWFDVEAALNARATSKVTKVLSCEEYDYVVGAAANAYPVSLGLVKFDRHLLFAKPDVILVFDDIEARRESEFDWLLQAEESAARVNDSRYVLKTGDAAMDVHFLLPRMPSVTLNKKELRCSLARAVRSRFLVLLHPRKAADRQSEARLESQTNGLFEVSVQTAGWGVSLKLDVAGKTVKTVRTRPDQRGQGVWNDHARSRLERGADWKETS